MTYPDYIDTTIEHLHTAKNSKKTEKSADSGAKSA